MMIIDFDIGIDIAIVSSSKKHGLCTL